MLVIDDVKNALLSKYPHLNLDKVVFEPCRHHELGDLSTNAVMVLKKQGDFESFIVDFLTNHPIVETVNTTKGFINIRLKKEFWVEILKNILKDGELKPHLEGQGKTINVEYVSVNPTGPLHIGHARNAVFGDMIASLFDYFGYHVTREYYVNDAGGQIDALVSSVQLRIKELNQHPITDKDFSADMYRGTYLIPVAEKVQQEKPTHLKSFIVERMMEAISHDLKDLGIHIDTFTSEQNILNQGYLEKAFKILHKRGDLYHGVLPPPKGHDGDWEEREQLLFKSTTYGDDTDRPLQKHDGTWTYFAGDVAYHLYKISRHYDVLIDVFGADHAGHILKLQSAVHAMSGGNTPLHIRTCQMVNFLDQGVPLRMSKRAGNFVTLRDLIERIGKDPIRFMMASRHPSTTFDFDFEKVVEKTKENHLFYIQYAHARICSVLKRAKSHGIEPLFHEHLLSDDDVFLIKMMYDFSRQMVLSLKHLEPHRICQYLYDLATHFHQFWEKNRLLNVDEPVITQHRLAVVVGVQKIIQRAFKVLKIDPLDEL